MDVSTDDTGPITQRAPMAHLVRLVAQSKPPPPRRPVIEELSPDDFELVEE